ncbi:MAG: DUF1576 domain-containing protein [Clostridiales bacterium]|jgi:xanthosine utilization system XapX-like protein|nr:DUF1576 domain-containing protein [Clostridiales bacterium]
MTETAARRSAFQENFLKKPYRVHALLFVFYIAYGFVWASPREILDGMMVILTAPNILVTDYIYIAGLGATFVNVGIMGLLALWVLVATRHRPFGLDMGVLGLVTGFAFFGKNPLNMLPILIGAYLFSRVTKRPFEENVVPALLGNALAPAVSALAHVYYIPTAPGIALGALVGIFIGFTISPLAVWMRRAHEGYNLYNIGFTAGIFALSLMALYRNLGIEFEPRALWSSGNNTALIIYLAIISIYFTVVGLLADTEKKVSLKDLLLLKTEDFDYYKWYQEKSYIAMGILGFACLAFMAAMRAEYTGLAIGAILSVVGFGAFGKSLLHAIPIVVGTLLANFANYISFGEEMNTNGNLVAILFSTCLTPISKVFGWKWGLVAGFLHLSLATNIGIFHGGMNLYNNGLAGGIVAMILLPIIRVFNRKKEESA